MIRGTLLLVPLVFAACRPPADGAVAHGTIEVRETHVSPIVAARVVQVNVDEGSLVRRGDTLALLTRASVAPAIERERARLSAARATLSDLEQGALTEERRAALADLAGAEADLDRTRKDLKRIKALADAGATSPQQLDAAAANNAVAQSRRDAAAERLDLLRRGGRPDQVRRARADIESARAVLSAAEADLNDMVLLAAADGVVLDRYAQPGEVLAAGEPVLTLGATHDPWVRAWVPQSLVANLRVGQQAVVKLDAGPQEYPGTITLISPRAEFTPRAALTEQERADLMFAIRVAVHDTTGLVKPGLSATVRFPAP